jgi:hypothetical protein
MLARVRGALALAVLLAAMFTAGVTAASPSARLVYSRSTDAASCPDEVALRSAVAARVGYDPFFPSAKRAILASMTRRGRAFVASVELIDDDGIAHGARELHVERDCGGLIDAAALAIAIAIDPTLLERPPIAPSPPPKVVPQPQQSPPILPPAATAAPSPPAATSSSAAAPPPRSMTFDATGGVAVAAGVAPREAVGASLGFGIAWRALSLALEGRIDAPAGLNAARGAHASSWLVFGDVAPCARSGPVFGCALFELGSAQASASGVLGARSASTPWRAVGGRLGVRAPFVAGTSLAFHSDVVGNLDPATLVLAGSPVWTAPHVASSFGVDLVFHFP